jgi:hypothetical protein
MVESSYTGLLDFLRMGMQTICMHSQGRLDNDVFRSDAVIDLIVAAFKRVPERFC